MLEELKSCFMEAYDDNQDGKIDIREVRVKQFFLLKAKLLFFESILIGKTVSFCFFFNKNSNHGYKTKSRKRRK